MTIEEDRLLQCIDAGQDDPQTEGRLGFASLSCRATRFAALLAFAAAGLCGFGAVRAGQALAQAAPDSSTGAQVGEEFIRLMQVGGRASCPSCSCDCAWASDPKACAPQADDGHCCWHCCCSDRGWGTQPYGGSMEGSYNFYHDYDRLPARPGDRQFSDADYRYYHHYHPGDVVRVVPSGGGAPVQVQIVGYEGDGNYHVTYLDCQYHGQGGIVSIYNMDQPQTTYTSTLVWIFVFGVIALVGGYAFWKSRSEPA